MAGKHQMGAVSKMRRHRRARGRRFANLLRRCRRMTDGNLHPAGGTALDKCTGFRPFEGKRDDAYSAFRRILPALKQLPIWRLGEGSRVSSAGTILGGNEWSFQMDAGNADSAVRILGACSGDRLHRRFVE